VRPAPENRPRREILLVLCAAGFVLFNFPMLVLWDRDTTVFGLPLLPLALFAIWAGLIGALAWASERGRNHGETLDRATLDGAADRTGSAASLPDD
jgi:hypothetical protein